MATWGYGIEQDDFVCGVMDEFDNQLKQNQNLQQTTKSLLETYQAVMDDVNEGPLFRLALARMLWNYGKADVSVLAQVRSDFEKNTELERWRKIGETAFEKRKQVIADFIEKISTENTKPKKYPKMVVRKPIFAAGDCLSIQLSNGMFGAALVLAADHSNTESGKNLIALLNVMEPNQPDLSVFEKRDWLILTRNIFEKQAEIYWYAAQGYRAAKQRFTKIGTVSIMKTDPQIGRASAGWPLLGEQIILQRKWDQSH